MAFLRPLRSSWLGGFINPNIERRLAKPEAPAPAPVREDLARLPMLDRAARYLGQTRRSGLTGPQARRLCRKARIPANERRSVVRVAEGSARIRFARIMGGEHPHGQDWRTWPHWHGPYMMPCTCKAQIALAELLADAGDALAIPAGRQAGKARLIHLARSAARRRPVTPSR